MLETVVNYAAMTNQIPLRLERDPIVDCLIQTRLKLVSDSASEVLPGILYKELGDQFPQHAKTPVSQIPSNMRREDDNLRYQPVVELVGPVGRVGIAESAVQLRVTYPYPGWAELRPVAERVLGCVMNSGLVASYERLSVLYNNVITCGADGFDLAPLELDLTIGRDIGERVGTMLRTEFPHELGSTIVQVQTGAQARIEQEGKAPIVLEGVHLGVDTIAFGNIRNFEDMQQRLNHVRVVEREIFFRMLKPETCEQLGPVWEE